LSTGRATLHVTSISQNGNAITGPCVGARIHSGASCEFSVGWAGGPGGGPIGPVVTIVSDAPTSPTVIHIPYQ
jgi:hypothetical protein